MMLSSLMQFSDRWRRAIIETSPSSIPLISDFLAKPRPPLLGTFSVHVVVRDTEQRHQPQSTAYDIFRRQGRKVLSFSHLLFAPPLFDWSYWSQLTNFLLRLVEEGWKNCRS
jgi:hypothetical protein